MYRTQDFRMLSAAIVGIFLIFSMATARASQTQAQKEYAAAASAARKALKAGPTTVFLSDQARLKLPKGYGFIPGKQAARLLVAMGNVIHRPPLGMIIPMDGGQWFVVARYRDAGYIKDDDAKHWDAAKLLESIRQGTEEANKERRKRGIPDLVVNGWVESPKYDSASHQLVWSVSAHDKGDNSADAQGINYNTYALGREGYISMNLITDLKAIDADKPAAHALLAGLHFNTGKRYGDFNPSTDKVAAYGLAALVAGVAAKKLGLLAIVGAFVAKFAKVLLIAAAAAAGGLGKWFGGRKKKSSPTA
jgi:uncharacterized membrane-anchored protein